MLVTLLKHHWKSHRSISITYLGYLILLLIIFNFQNTFTYSSYFLKYAEYFQENPIDYISKSEIVPETLDIEDIGQEIDEKNKQKSIAKHALLFYYVLTDVNLTVTYNEGQKKKTFFHASLSIGALKEEQFEVLEEFQTYINRTKIPPGGTQTLHTLTYELNISGSEYINFSIISVSTQETYSIESRGSFSWYSSNLIGETSIIHFFVPLNTFVNWFRNETIHVVTLIQQNRHWLYTFDNPQENYEIASSLNYPFNYIEIIGSGTRYLTLNFFAKNRTPFSPNVDLLIYSLPSILVGLLFCTLYTRLWSKEFLKTWLFFKPRGLDYGTFSVSYLIYSSLLALISTSIAAILSCLSENFFFIIIFSIDNPHWFTRFPNYIVLPFILALSISLWSFGNGVRNLKTLTVQELKLEPLKEKNPYPWASLLVFAGLVGISLPLLVKLKLFHLTTLSLALEMWLVIILYFLLILAPLAIIIGMAALSARYFLTIKTKIDRLLVRFSSIAFVYPKGLNPQKISLIIVILTFQLFLTLTTINSPFIESQTIYNRIGAEYATEYLSINEYQAKTLEKIIINDIPQVKETWSNTLGVGFDIITGRKILIYRYNATEIPEQYPLTSSARTVLLQAFEEKQGIILSTGKVYTRNNITLSFEKDQNVTITLINKRVTVSGFLYPETETYHSSGIPEPPETIQLLIPRSIPFENITFQEQIRIQFYSEDSANEKIRNKITSLCKQTLETYVYVMYSEEQVSPNSILLPVQISLFSIFASLSFVLLFMTDLTSRGYLFGPYLIRGMTFSSMRKKLLIESFFLLSIATIISWIVAVAMVYWFVTMQQFSSLDPLILPIIPFDSQVLFFALVVLFVISYFTVLRIKLKEGSLLPYIRQIE